MKEVLIRHIRAYPAMTVTDAVKLCYQSAFGGGHLITDEARALAFLHTERKQLLQSAETPLTEEIGGGVVRLNLAASQAATLSDAHILRAFAASAAHIAKRTDNDALFHAALDALRALASEGAAPFTLDALDAYLTQYRANGCPPVSHSPEYRAQNAPAYRVMGAEFAALLPLLGRIDALLSANMGRCVTVAIDGYAAAGKSTCAAALSAMYDSCIFHMDDYFLPPQRRTPERLSVPGGNVDHERFSAEILTAILAQKPALHSAFDCQSGTLLPPKTTALRPLVIVEGSYSHHPKLSAAWNLRIAIDVEAQTQRDRIRCRNGPQMLRLFEERWIPMEHHYFQALRIFENADAVIRVP